MVHDIYVIEKENQIFGSLTDMFSSESDYVIHSAIPEDIDVVLRNIPSIIIINESSIYMNILDLCRTIRSNEDNSITPVVVVTQDFSRDHKMMLLAEDVQYIIDYIKDHNIDRVIFYSLNPHKETIYANSSQPASLYYAQVVAQVRLAFPDIEIICGTWIDNLANIGILILSGANGITKFPLFKMFATKYGKRVEEEVKWAGRELKGTFTDKNQLGPEKSEISPELDKFIKRYVKESLKNKY